MLSRDILLTLATVVMVLACVVGSAAILVTFIDLNFAGW